ncbi:MAG: PA2169 family four-helix-bundle protein [Bacteroidia bacterium]
MLASDEKPVQILNELIIVNNGRLEGFHYASMETDASVLKVLFSRLTETSMVFKKELVNEVYKLGGEPGVCANVPYEVSKAWDEVKDALIYKDHLTLLRSCGQEETAIIKLYENVLWSEEENMTTQHQRLFSKHCELLNADHNKIKNLLNVLLKTN